MRRRPAWDYGRWLLQRQRLHIGDPEPPVPGGPAPIGAVVQSVMKKAGLDSALWREKLQSCWPGIVGETLARRTRPGAVEGAALVVYVQHSIFLHELSRDRAAGERLLANLRRCLPEAPLQTVRFQIDPGERDG
jgi:hypothetical protein